MIRFSMRKIFKGIVILVSFLLICLAGILAWDYSKGDLLTKAQYQSQSKIYLYHFGFLSDQEILNYWKSYIGEMPGMGKDLNFAYYTVNNPDWFKGFVKRIDSQSAQVIVDKLIFSIKDSGGSDEFKKASGFSIDEAKKQFLND
jgi:hypothetical protein